MKKICLYCEEEFETKTKSPYCSREHQIKHKNILEFPDGSGYVECKICGLRGDDLNKHIKSFHKMTIEEYCQKFNIEKIELQSEKLRKHNSDMQKLAYKEGRLKGWGKGDDNPSRRKEVRDGRLSVFSLNYKGYDGLTQEEKQQKIDALLKDLANKKKENCNNPLTVDYYLKRGFSEAEAKQKVKERQTTFSKEKCIEKYGEEEGLKIFNERQKKWQETLNSKSPEEIERINKAKMFNGKGYSNMSQELFNKINDIIKNDFDHIFYATNNPEKSNNEYTVINKETNKHYFLDFYVKDNNKVIEFDGDYWHGGPGGNQERDRKRQEDLIKLGYTNILHVKERDFKNNPEKTINECINFIRK
jgi:very-short-patch-repair endonuclease